MTDEEPQDAPRGGAVSGAGALGRVVVVLDQPQNLVNSAAIIRAMLNMGMGRLRLVCPAFEFDEYRIEGIAHRSGPLIEATEIVDSLEEGLADCSYVVGTSARSRTASRNYVRPRQAAPGWVERTAEGRNIAILFGREDRGLSNEALDYCNEIAVIPTDPEYSSLNLAQACLLVLYEFFVAAESEMVEPLPVGRRERGPATREELESMYTALEEGLAAIRFFKGSRQPESVLRTLRTLLDRAEPDLRESRLVRAIGFEMKYVFERLRDSD